MMTPSHTSSDSLALLRRIAQDDQFRAKLESNPQAALATYGVEIDPSSVPQKVTLPGKAATRESLEDLGEGLSLIPNFPFMGVIGGR